MHGHQLDVMLLSDLHHGDCKRWSCKKCVVGMEEYQLIIGDSTAIILSPAAQLARAAAGSFQEVEPRTGRANMVLMEAN